MSLDVFCNNGMMTNSSQGWKVLVPGLVFGILAAALLSMLFLANGSTANARLADADCYMWLLRAETWISTGDWTDQSIARANAPIGDTTHWTWPFGLVLAAGAQPLLPWLPLRDALFWWGTFVSPALLLTTILGTLWLTRFIFDQRGRFALSVFLVSQPPILLACLAGRPDHHSLLLFWFAIWLCLWVRAVEEPKAVRLSIAAGVAGAAGLWTSVEFFPALAVALATGGLLWLRDHHEIIRSQRMVTLSLAIASIVFLLINPPAGAQQVFDRLSLPWIVPLFLSVGFWFFIAVRFNNLLPKLIAAFLFALIVGGIQFVLFPRFFLGPYADVPPDVAALWLNKVIEVRPLLQHSKQSLLSALPWIGAALLGTLIAIPMALSPNRLHSHRWLLLAVALPVFVVLGFLQIRWCMYAAWLAVFPMTALLLWLCARLPVVMQRAGFLVLLVAIAAVFPATAVLRIAGSEVPTSSFPSSSALRELWRTLGSQSGHAPQRVLTELDFGPEILYFTPFEVVATGYHRNIAGLRDAFAALNTSDWTNAADVIRRRGVTLIVISVKGNSIFFEKSGSDPSVYTQLSKGTYPPWLEDVLLPDHVAREFRVYRVHL